MRVAGAALLLLTAVSMMTGCSSPVWRSKFERGHPLVGRIWDVDGARFTDSGAVIERAVAAKFVILGEKHDNRDHHRLQAQVLRGMIVAGRRPAVAFEMLSTDQAAAVARQLAAAPRDVAGLAKAVNWKRSGWPDFAMYRPIFEAALEAGLPIIAANLPSKTARETSRQGTQALDADLVSRHALDRPLGPDVEASMAKEIQDSHCGQAPAAFIPRMVIVQRARDAQMADAVVDAGARDGAVLITGNGHARKDRGVPAGIRRRIPDASVLSVAFLEVEESLMSGPEYARDLGSDRLPYDVGWFTPRVDKKDPCEEFKSSLERLRDRK